MTTSTELTLSEADQVGSLEGSTAAASTGRSVRTADPAYHRIEELLGLAERARLRGYVDLAEAYTDRIVDEVWGPV